MPAARRSIPTFAVIGLAGGLFAALFGVGGGIIIVPMLVLLAGLPEKRATGTSLAAIAFTGVFGAFAYGILDKVDLRAAAIIGLPAVGGVLAGVWLQQRVPARLLVCLFAALLIGIAVRLLL